MIAELSHFAVRLGQVTSCLQEDHVFNELALELFALQFKYNPAYQKICQGRGLTPKDVRDWTQIPFVPTAAFKELELSSIPLEERTAVFHSSGTTEQKPSRHFHCAESLELYEASVWKWFGRNIVNGRKFDLVILTPPSKLAPHSSLAHMFETARRELNAPESVFAGKLDGDGAWTLDFNKLTAAFSGMEHPKLILGTAFSFVHLLDYLAEKDLRFDLPHGTRVMETGGYKNRSRSLPKRRLHFLIATFLGIARENIICEYGMSELSSQAYDTIYHERSLTPSLFPAGGESVRRTGEGGIHGPAIQHDPKDAERRFRFPPWARAQIVSPEMGQEVNGGETGLIRVFDLANVFSVAAIQTEDLGTRRGSGFELAGRAPLAEARGCSLMTA